MGERMATDDYLYYEKTEVKYSRTLHLDGVRIAVSNNTFEISVHDTTEIWEQLAVQNLREWIRWRKEQAEMREPRSVPR